MEPDETKPATAEAEPSAAAEVRAGADAGAAGGDAAAGASQSGDAAAGEVYAGDPLTASRDALAVPVSNRLLWIGAAVALIAHIAPFVYLGEPKPLGEDVLTEAIAVDIVDKATLEGRDHTPEAPAAPASPPPAPAAEPQQAPPGPQQAPQQAIPPAPPPTPPAPRVEPKAAEPAPSVEPKAAEPAAKALPAFEGDRPDVFRPKKQETKTKPDEAKQPPRETPQREVKPRPPQPKRPPPQRQVAPRAPTAAQPSPKAAPPRAPSRPALARSGEVSEFAKQVVAALAKAKPQTAGIKGRVTVTVVVAFGGGVRTARVVASSGQADLDKLALEAARKAPLPAPPQGITTDDLFYDVEYVFE